MKKTLLVIGLMIGLSSTSLADVRIQLNDHRDGTVTFSLALPAGAHSVTMSLWRASDFAGDDLAILLQNDPRGEIELPTYRTFRVVNRKCQMPFLLSERGERFVFKVFYLDSYGVKTSFSATEFRLQRPEPAKKKKEELAPIPVPRDPFFNQAKQ